MIKRTLLRSGLQLLGLCVLALFLSTTRVDAAANSCQEQSAACATHCGTYSDWVVVGQTWDPDRMVHVWDPVEGWVWVNDPGYVDVFGATFGYAVEYRECIPDDGGNGLCMCGY